jgi:hypothetical protein
MRTPNSIFASISAVGFAVGSIAALGAGCDPGSVGDDDVVQDELLCSAALTITGTFTIGTPKPVEINGCWPIGAWTFTAAVGEHDCAAAPTPLPSYQIRVDRDTTSEDPDYSWLYTYVTDPADATADVSVTSGGGGLCEGIVVVYSADGKTVWNMHPGLQADNTLLGTGDYEIHTANQVPSSAQ